MSGDVTRVLPAVAPGQVRPGGRYRVGPVQIEVDFLELMPFAAITPVDIRRCGERDRESRRQRDAYAGPIADDTFLYRVEFHLVEAAAR